MVHKKEWTIREVARILGKLFNSFIAVELGKKSKNQGFKTQKRKLQKNILIDKKSWKIILGGKIKFSLNFCLF